MRHKSRPKGEFVDATNQNKGKIFYDLASRNKVMPRFHKFTIVI